jgi:hypothetical protein
MIMGLSFWTSLKRYRESKVTNMVNQRVILMDIVMEILRDKVMDMIMINQKRMDINMGSQRLMGMTIIQLLSKRGIVIINFNLRSITMEYKKPELTTKHH